MCGNGVRVFSRFLLEERLVPTGTRCIPIATRAGVRAAELLGRAPEDTRVVVAHLGNGCSATAVRDGVSVDTTMGLTPLEGLVMGTRSGDVDPGLFAHLARTAGLDAAAAASVLPEEPPQRAVAELDAWLQAVRHAEW